MVKTKTANGQDQDLKKNGLKTFITADYERSFRHGYHNYLEDVYSYIDVDIVKQYLKSSHYDQLYRTGNTQNSAKRN